MSDEVYDANGKLIEVGARVGCVEGEDGVVTKITDWDGDMRDGQMVGYPPRVYVKWPEFDEPEDFPTGMRPDERTYCDDVEVIVDPTPEEIAEEEGDRKFHLRHDEGEM